MSGLRDKAETQLSDAQKLLLKGYGKWRPRIGRGAQFAVPTALLAGIVERGEKRRSKKLIIPTVIAAAAGVGDKMLEERAQKSRQVRKLVGSGFDKKAAEPDQGPTDSKGVSPREPWSTFTQGAEEQAVACRQGVLEGLFSRKARMGAKARSQLGALFPRSDSDDSYGQSVTVAEPAAGAAKAVRRAFRR